MLLELSLIPLGRGPSISADLAEAIKIVDASGLDYRVNAAGTVIEGDWDQLLNVARQCHQTLRAKASRVITLMKIDDYETRTGRLTAAVDSLAQKVGKPVKR